MNRRNITVAALVVVAGLGLAGQYSKNGKVFPSDYSGYFSAKAPSGSDNGETEYIPDIDPGEAMLPANLEAELETINPQGRDAGEPIVFEPPDEDHAHSERVMLGKREKMCSAPVEDAAPNAFVSQSYDAFTKLVDNFDVIPSEEQINEILGTPVCKSKDGKTAYYLPASDLKKPDDLLAVRRSKDGDSEKLTYQWQSKPHPKPTPRKKGK